MTELDTYTPRTAPQTPGDRHTIYRDTPLTYPALGAPRTVQANLRGLVQHDEHLSDGILLGLGALTVPAVAYSLAQLWNLISNGTLEHAIRAFVP